MLYKLTAVAGWAWLAFIICATVSPLHDRPTLSSSADLEHIGAFSVLGGLFCVAYPRHTVLVCLIVLGSATLLEVLVTPDRHGRFVDGIQKIVGGAGGITAGRAFLS